ncbi:MAG: LytTR family DNA-binding domain-containing protein [Bacteroidota bacterium]
MPETKNLLLRVVVIDDEPDAVSALCTLILEFTIGAEVVGTASSALEGIRVINKMRPDLILLDIDMPGGTGFELLDAFPDRFFKVVFTTASSSFAIKALKTKAHDYLLKPIDVDELRTTLDLAREPEHKLMEDDPTLPLPDLNGYTYVKIRDIIHLNGEGNYTTVYYGENGKSVVSKNIKYFETLLAPYAFFRCHQSYIINLSKVQQLKKNEGTYLVMSNGNRVEVSRANKEELTRLLNG